MVFITVVLTSGATLEAQDLDRIYVDQYMPLRSELMIADADGSNPRKLVPGSEIDYKRVVLLRRAAATEWTERERLAGCSGKSVRSRANPVQFTVPDCSTVGSHTGRQGTASESEPSGQGIGSSAANRLRTFSVIRDTSLS